MILIWMESIEFIKLKVKVSHQNSLQPATNSAETNVKYIDFITLSDFKKNNHILHNKSKLLD